MQIFSDINHSIRGQISTLIRDSTGSKKGHQNSLAENFLEEKIKLPIKLNNDTLFLNRYFLNYFGTLPRYVYSDPDGVIFFAEEKQILSIQKALENKIKQIQRRLSGRLVQMKIYADTLGEFVINVFSHVRHRNMFDLHSKLNKRTKTLAVYLRILDGKMPFALGKKGKNIHMINRLMETIRFDDEELDKSIKRIQIFLRS